MLVGVERQGDDEGPVRADRPYPGDLETPQGRIREHGRERPARVGDSLSEEARHRPMVKPFASRREEREDLASPRRLVFDYADRRRSRGGTVEDKERPTSSEDA